MSPLGHFRHFDCQPAISGLPQPTDIARSCRQVGFGP